MTGFLTAKQLSEKFPLANLSNLPTTNPGGGKPWLSGGAVVVGNYAGNTVDWSAIANKPTEFTPTAHTHDDRYYTKSQIDAGYAKLSGGNSFSGNQVVSGTIDASATLTGHRLGYLGFIDSVTLGWPGTSFGGFQSGSSGVLSFALRSAGISSSATGVISIGNGTYGNASGNLQLANLTAGATITVAGAASTGTLLTVGTLGNANAFGVIQYSAGGGARYAWARGEGLYAQSDAGVNQAAISQYGVRVADGVSFEFSSSTTNTSSIVHRIARDSTAATIDSRCDNGIRSRNFANTASAPVICSLVDIVYNGTNNTFVKYTDTNRVIGSGGGAYIHIGVTPVSFGVLEGSVGATKLKFQTTASQTMGTTNVVLRPASGVLEVMNAAETAYTSAIVSALTVAPAAGSGGTLTLGGFGSTSNNIESTGFLQLKSATGSGVILTAGATEHMRATNTYGPVFKGYIGLGTTADSAPDVYFYRNGSAAAAVLANNGTAFRNQANNADTSITCFNITASGVVSSAFRSLSADPSTLDISAGLSQLVKNTTSGEIRLWANDAGTMKKSAALT